MKSIWRFLCRRRAQKQHVSFGSIADNKILQDVWNKPHCMSITGGLAPAPLPVKKQAAVGDNNCQEKDER